jgi:ComF family protein
MINDFVSLLFPRCCAISGEPLAKGEQYISLSYAASMPRYDLTIANENLNRKFSGIVKVEHVWAYYKFSKKSGVQKLLHQIKYKNLPEVGELASKWFGQNISRLGVDLDLVLPVPLHPAKKRKRGYNQADYIAKGIATGLQINWSDEVLVRTVNTSTQTKKGRIERFNNTENIYAVSDPNMIIGKKILIVDDVITTGATIGQCAQLLLDAGCKEVNVAALAAAE